jgi:predicted permease
MSPALLAPRALRKHWKLTAVAVFSLSIAMALVVLSLSVSNTALLLPPAAPAPDRLVMIYSRATNTADKGVDQISYPDYRYFRQNNHVFTDIAAAPNSIALLVDSDFGNREARVMARPVSANYFDVIGVRPLLGRFFSGKNTSGKDTSGNDTSGPLTAVMTYACWQRLGGDPHIIGKQLGGHTIIGIAPRSFTGSFYGLNGDLLTLVESGDMSWTTKRDSRQLFLIARLRPGVSRQQAQTDIAGLSARLATAWPKEDGSRTAVVTRATLLPPDALPTAELASGILVGLVLLVLLIACTNVANLLLALAVGRRQEAAIKMALGAARGRLIREFLRESAVLCAIGAVTGYAIAAAVIRRFSSLSIEFPMYGTYSFGLNLRLDFTVFALTFALMFIAVLAAGLVPALYASSPHIARMLSGELVLGGTGKGVRRNALVIAQVAICTLVLVGLGLCQRNLYNLRQVDLGFTARNLVAMTEYLAGEGYSEARGKQMYGTMRRAVAALPGVESVTLARDLPLFGGHPTPVRLPDSLTASMKTTSIDYTVVDSEYFATLGIPLLQGRVFNNSDRENTPATVVVNRKLAETLWPGQDPLGKPLVVGEDPVRMTVVGVVADGKYDSVDEPRRGFMYYPLAQHYEPGITVIARTSGDPARWVQPFDRAIRATGFKTPVRPVTFEHWFNLILLGERIVAGVVAALSALGLLLAAIGLAGAVSSAISQRTRELGLRVALGASPGQLMRMVLRQVLLVAGTGVVLGLLLGVSATILLRSQFYQIGQVEWSVLVPVCALMLAISLVVAWLAARPWINADPMTAVRHN